MPFDSCSKCSKFGCVKDKASSDAFSYKSLPMLYGFALMKEFPPTPTHKRASAWKNKCKYSVFVLNGKEYLKEFYFMNHYG